MHFFKAILASAFAAVALAQNGDLKFTKAPYNVQAGSTYTLQWTGGDQSGEFTILLREGQNTDLHTISTLTTTATGGSYQWTVPSTIADASQYALQITQGSLNNYWGQIAIAGGSGTLSTSATASSASASSASSMSSAMSSAVSSAMSSASSASASSASATSSASSASSSSASASASQSSASTSRAFPSSASAAAPSGSQGAAPKNLNANVALVLGAAAAIAYIA